MITGKVTMQLILKEEEGSSNTKEQNKCHFGDSTMGTVTKISENVCWILEFKDMTSKNKQKEAI